MRRRLIFSALLASTVGINFSAARAAQEPQEYKVTAVVKGDEPIEVRGQKLVGHVWLGVTLKNIEGDLSEFLGTDKGVLIEEVHPTSPAAKADVKKGDVILSIDGTQIAGPEQVLNIMKSAKPDVALKLKLKRKSEELELKVTPEPRPVEIAAGMKWLEEFEKNGLAFDRDAEHFKLLRVGIPTGAIASVVTPIKGDIQIHVTTNQDGKVTEIKVDRQGDKPAEIKVTKDGETKTYTTDNLEQLPEEVRSIITPIVQPSLGHSVITLDNLNRISGSLESLDGLQAEADKLKRYIEALGKGDGKLDHAQQALEQALSRVAAGADHAKATVDALNSPEFRKQLEDIRAQVSAQISEAANKAALDAKRAIEEAQAKAAEARLQHAQAAKQLKQSQNDKSEVEELRQLVNQLKKEIADLKAAREKK